MGRLRRKDTHLPPKLHLRAGSYYYTPFVDGKVVWKNLGSDLSAALREWAEREGAEPEDKKGSTGTVAKAIEKYVREVLPSRALRTQQDYRRYAANLKPVFGSMRLSAVKAKHIAKYLYKSGNTQANREMSFLSSVFDSALRWSWVSEYNPCRQVRRNPEKKRSRLVTDKELQMLFEKAPPHIAAMVELVLLTALRKTDVLKIKLEDLRKEGLYVKVSKTGRVRTYKWSPGLRAAIKRAKALPRRVGAVNLFTNKAGEQYTISGFDSVWQAFKRRAGLDFTFHDLRARALTDAKKKGGRDYAQLLADHASGDTTEIYLRGREVQTVEPLR